jgi:hypothetical protein
LIYVLPVTEDILHRGSAKVSPVGPDNPGAYGFVITVEYVVVIRVKGLIPFAVGDEQERFEKPGAVPQVPFGGAHIDYGLDYVVLGLERTTDIHRPLPYFVVLI